MYLRILRCVPVHCILQPVNLVEPGRFVIKPCSQCPGIQPGCVPIWTPGRQPQLRRDSVNQAYRIMPVYYGFTRWSCGGETDTAGRAIVMPLISPMSNRKYTPLVSSKTQPHFRRYITCPTNRLPHDDNYLKCSYQNMETTCLSSFAL